MIPLNVKSPLTHAISEMPMIRDEAAIYRLTGFAKFTLPSIHILAPNTPIIPNKATVTPPLTPAGVAESTAPNFGDRANKIAPTPAKICEC